MKTKLATTADTELDTPLSIVITAQDHLALQNIAVRDGSYSMSASMRRLIRQEARNIGLEYGRLQGAPAVE